MITIKKVYRADNGDVFATLENDYNRDPQDWAALVREAEAMVPTPCQSETITDPIQALLYKESDGTFIADSAFIAPELKGYTLAHGFYLSRAERSSTASERAAKAVLHQAKLRRMQKKEHLEFNGHDDRLIIDGMWTDPRFPTGKIVQIDEDFYLLPAGATCRDGFGTAKALVPLPDYTKPDGLEQISAKSAASLYKVAFRHSTIPLREYANAHGKTDSAARRMAIAGRFKTAKKLGRDWVIDENEPWPIDNRLKGNKRGLH